MDFSFTPEQLAFREEIRRFLAAELDHGQFPRISYGASTPEAFSRPFSRLVAQKGWTGLAWPKEHGGQGKSFVDQLIYTDEMVFGGAPVACHWLAERQVGPALMSSGTGEQRREFLPRILAGDMAFCLGISEPGAGSDMASMQTKASDEGEYFVINGQKTFNGGADLADYVLLVARTGAPDSRHRGLSTFLVDLKLPGVTVQPMATVFGTRPLNNIFFDNVRLPRRYLLGPKNGGWLIATVQLNFDRSAVEFVSTCRRVLTDLVNFVQQRRGYSTPPLVRQRLAELAVDIEVGHWLSYRVAWLQSQGLSPEVETSMAKVFNSELMHRVATEGIRILGLYGNLIIGSKLAPLEGWLADWCPMTLGRRVASGASEIQRNIIAQRGLALPR
ncbi:MAG: acyl-CoA dehydrogenase family protein [Chloroflexi bacterium]|nr:acyl-CoA dehydrogenase family protein [Chloroflexota bacterium]